MLHGAPHFASMMTTFETKVWVIFHLNFISLSILSTFTTVKVEHSRIMHTHYEKNTRSFCKICMWHSRILGTQDYSSLHSPWAMLIWMWNSFNFTFSMCGLSFGFPFSCGNRNQRGYDLYLKETFFFSVQWTDISQSSVLFFMYVS